MLEQVDQGNDVGVLAHLQYVYLPPLLVDFNWLHVLLVHRLDGHLLASLFVRGQLDEPELSLAQVVLEVVVIEQIRIANDLLKALEPIELVMLLLEVQDPRLVRRKHDLDWVQVASFRVAVLHWHIFDKRAHHGMHYSVVLVPFLPVAVKLVTCKNSPVLFIPVSLGLQKALPFKDAFLVRFDISKSLDWFLG